MLGLRDSGAVGGAGERAGRGAGGHADEGADAGRVQAQHRACAPNGRQQQHVTWLSECLRWPCTGWSEAGCPAGLPGVRSVREPMR